MTVRFVNNKKAIRVFYFLRYRLVRRNRKITSLYSPTIIDMFRNISGAISRYCKSHKGV